MPPILLPLQLILQTLHLPVFSIKYALSPYQVVLQVPEEKIGPDIVLIKEEKLGRDLDSSNDTQDVLLFSEKGK